MIINPDFTSLEYYAQYHALHNPNGTLNLSMMQIKFPGQSKTLFKAACKSAGYAGGMPYPRVAETQHLSKQEFLEMYEFGTPVQEYLIKAATKGRKLEKQTLFKWVAAMHPAKNLNYGRDYSKVTFHEEIKPPAKKDSSND